VCVCACVQCTLQAAAIAAIVDAPETMRARFGKGGGAFARKSSEVTGHAMKMCNTKADALLMKGRAGGYTTFNMPVGGV